MEKLKTEHLEGILASKKYDNKYTNIPNSKLGDAPIREQLTRILEAAGYEWDNDDSYLVVKADEGVFDRLFLPTVYNCQMETGDKAALRFSRNLRIPLVDLEKVGEVDFDDRTLVFLLNDEENPLLAKFHLFTADAEEPPEKMELKQAWKKGKLEDLLGKEPKMVNRRKLSELEDGDEITVFGYKSIPTKFGEMYSLKTDQGEEFLANTAIKKVLNANPEISQEKPAKCSILSRRETPNGNIVVNATLEVAEDAFGSTNMIDLSF